MIFRKDYWGKCTLNKCSSFIRGVTYSNRDEVDVNGHCILRANNISLDNKVNLDDIKHISSKLKLSEEKRLKKNDILICTASGSVDHIGKVAFFEEDSHYFAGGFMGIVRANSDIIIPYFLYSVFLIPIFVKLLKSQRAGTNIQNLKFSDIENNEIPLPPLEEQTQIVALFQSIDSAIEQVEEQEQRLKELRKSLSNGLLSNEPIFGKLLIKENYSIVKFSNFTESIEKHDKNKKDEHRFVGLENIEPEDFTIKTWGNIEDGTTFTKRFQKGDVLFGKRRAYLKKVAVADFDGICSSDILVLRAKQDKMIPELLPFYISAEPFIQYAVSTSAGSLSPRTKWKDLGELEVAIPDLETQKKILTVMQNVESTRILLDVQKSNLKKLKQQLLNEILG